MMKEPDTERKMKYFTKRFIYKKGDLRAKTFEKTRHYAILWVYDDEPAILNINYKCPYCNHEDGKTGVFDSTTAIKFTCNNCGEIINAPKLYGKRKKKKKKKT